MTYSPYCSYPRMVLHYDSRKIIYAHKLYITPKQWNYVKSVEFIKMPKTEYKFPNLQSKYPKLDYKFK